MRRVEAQRPSTVMRRQIWPAGQRSQPSEARDLSSQPTVPLKETLRSLGTQVLSTLRAKLGTQASAQMVEAGDPPGTGWGLGGLSERQGTWSRLSGDWGSWRI